MIPFYDKTRGTHGRGLRADQPAVADVWVGSLYFVTDEGVLERSNGVTWESYSSSSSAAFAAGMLMSGLDEGPGQDFIIQQVIQSSKVIQQIDTATGSVNDFSLNGHDVILLVDNATLRTYTGFTVLGATPTAGDRVTIISIGAGHVNFVHDASSTAANRLLNFATTADTPIAAGKGKATYIYEDDSDRWELVDHNQGAWITAAFDAANYTSDSGTWVVGSGDIIAHQYFLLNKTLWMQVGINTTTVTGAPTYLRMHKATYGNFTFSTANGSQFSSCYLYDNGNINGQLQNNATDSISAGRLDGNPFTASVNLTYIRGTYIASVD